MSSESRDELLVVDFPGLIRVYLIKDSRDDPVNRVEVLLRQRDGRRHHLGPRLLAHLRRPLLLDHRHEHLVDLLRRELPVPVLVEQRERGLELLLDGPPVEDAHHRQVLVDLQRPVVVGVEAGEHFAGKILVHGLGNGLDEGGLGDLPVLLGVLLEGLDDAVELVAVNYGNNSK